MHHVGVFVVQVEQVDLVRQRAAIEAAFLRQHDVVAVRIGIDRAGPHAARRALAADDQRLDAELGEMRGERRAVERAGALLGDDHVARLRLEFRPDDEVGRIDRRILPLGGADEFGTAFAARVAGRIEDRQARGARRGEQALGRLDGVIGIMTAGAGEGLGELRGRLWAAAIDQLIKIDGQERRRRSDEGLAPVMGIDVENVRA